LANPKRNRQRGKEHQKRIAELFKGLNLGTLGGVDVLADKFAIECKSRVKSVIESWFAQAEKYTPKDKLPLLVVHIKGKRYENDYAVLRIKDLLSILEGENDG